MDVSPPLVTNWTKDPEAGRSDDPLAQPKTRPAMNSRLVQVEVSALGIHLRFIGVSRVMGKIARQVALSGRPDLGSPRLLVNWWIAALAMPYPIMPGVPPKAGWAPGNTKQPPDFKCFAANAAEIEELQTDCFHMRSEFLMKSGESAEPPAHPPRKVNTKPSASL
jgi:hypothetical protein